MGASFTTQALGRRPSIWDATCPPARRSPTCREHPATAGCSIPPVGDRLCPRLCTLTGSRSPRQPRIRPAWPEWRANADRTGIADPQSVPRTSCGPTSSHLVGYRLVTSDGTVFERGNLPFCGGLNTSVLPSQVVSMASTPSGRGYWLLLGDGSVYAFGNATWYGDLRGGAWRGGPLPPGAPVVAITASPDGKGYFVLTADGSVYAFGDAPISRFAGWAADRRRRRRDGGRSGYRWLLARHLQRRGLRRGRPELRDSFQTRPRVADRRHCSCAGREGLRAGYPRWRRLRVRIGVTRSDGARASRCVSRRNRRESLGQGLLAGDGIGDDHLLGQERLLR